MKKFLTYVKAIDSQAASGCFYTAAIKITEVYDVSRG